MSFTGTVLEDIKGVLHDLAAAASALHLHEQIDQIGKDAVTDGESVAKEAGTDLAADVSRETSNEGGTAEQAGVTPPADVSRETSPAGAAPAAPGPVPPQVS
ncbi:MAG TPA: hypothetical protein VGG50_11515 [Streptosporangiaceae bacterium]|jgi:hypothetical protein